jgi:hypothetical protein
MPLSAHTFIIAFHLLTAVVTVHTHTSKRKDITSKSRRGNIDNHVSSSIVEPVHGVREMVSLPQHPSCYRVVRTQESCRIP